MSKGHFKRRQGNHSQGPERRWEWFAVIIVVVVMIALYKIQPIKTIVQADVVKIKTWIAERKNKLKSLPATHTKRVAAANEDEDNQTIHFEFYTALSNMRVNTPDITPQPKAKAVVAQAPSKKAMAMKQPITSADELEKEFADKIKKDN